jgi:uncharacterized protein (AIM24 family)
MPNSYNYQTLPSNDNINAYSYCLEVRDAMFMRKGKMIAYYGNLRFSALGDSMYAVIVDKVFNAPGYISDFVIVNGQGKVVLGDNGNNIASYNLESGNLTVKSSHVLGFDSSLVCQESTQPGYLTLMGTGTFLASSNGPVHFIEPPCRVDEQALLGWADCPSPSYHYDYSYIRNIFDVVGSMVLGRTSGEEKQIDFFGQGTVLIQSSEEELAGRMNLQRLTSEISGLGQHDLNQLSSYINNLMRPGE